MFSPEVVVYLTEGSEERGVLANRAGMGQQPLKGMFAFSDMRFRFHFFTSGFKCYQSVFLMR